MSSKQVGLYLGPALFFLTLIFFNPPGLNDPSRAVLASSLWIAIWWITEAIPISVTALLPIILFPLSGGMELADTTASYGHKLVFLTMGGFIIAIAILITTMTLLLPFSSSPELLCKSSSSQFCKPPVVKKRRENVLPIKLI